MIEANPTQIQDNTTKDKHVLSMTQRTPKKESMCQ